MTDLERNGAFTVDTSDLSFREADIAATLDGDPAMAELLLQLVVNSWRFMDNRRKAKILCLSMTDEFRAWTRESIR